MLPIFAVENSGSPVIGIILTVVFTIGVALVFFLSQKQKKAVKDNASQKGWVALQDEATLKNLAPPFLRNYGEKETFDLGYRATVEGQEVIFFQYTRVVQEKSHIQYADDLANNADEHVRFAVASFAVPQNLGRVLIFPHSMFGNSGLHEGLQKINLEGNFGQYFDVFMPPNTQINALSILTPDTMAFFQDLGNHFRMELYDNRAWLISDNHYELTPDKIDNFLRYATRLRQELTSKPQTSSISA